MTGIDGQDRLPSRRFRRAATVMALEPRMMFDGAAAATDGAVAKAAASDAPAAPAAVPTESRAADPSRNGGKKEVAFIDSSVGNHQALLDGIKPGIEVAVIDGGQSGLAQIARWAETHSGYDAIHILSHGGAATLRLGSDVITSANLATDRVRADLTELGRALKSGGDLMLYGCEIGAGRDGVRFVGGLAALTGADVAASSDATGSARLGGDWVLETRTSSDIGEALHDVGFDGLLAIDTGTLPGLQQQDNGYNPALVRGQDGSLYLGMADNGELSIAFYKWNGTAWQSLTALTAAGLGYDRIRQDITFCVDAGGTLYAVASVYNFTGDPTTNTTRVGTELAVLSGGSWSHSVIESLTPGGSSGANYFVSGLDLVTDGNGKVVVSFFRDANTTFDAVAKYRNFLGSNASGSFVFSSSDPTNTLGGLAAIDMVAGSGGTVYVIYSDAANASFKIQAVVNGVASGSYQTIAVDPNAVTYVGAAADAAGSPHLVTYNTTSYAMSFWSVSAGTWSAQTITIAGAAYEPTVTVRSNATGSSGIVSDSSGNIYMLVTAYDDFTNWTRQGIRLICWDGAGWVDGKTGLARLDGLAQPVFNIDASGKVMIVDAQPSVDTAYTVGLPEDFVNFVGPVFGGGSTASLAEGTATGGATTVYTPTITAHNGTVGFALDPSGDAASFDIDASTGRLTFKSGVTLDYETKSTYTVTIRATDGDGTRQRAIAVSITNVNEAPSLSGDLALAAVNEDSAAPAGATVASLAGGLYSDPDNGAETINGIAVVGNAANAAAEGVWHYSTDGVTWAAVGTVSDASALVLSASTRLRFVPAADFSGIPAGLTVRAVDASFAGSWSTNATRQTVNATSTGGATPYAATTRSVTTSVTAVNDAPTVSGLGTATPYLENTIQAVPAPLFTAGVIADIDSASFNGGYLRVTGSAAGDVLSIAHVGAAAGQIGVSGSTVSYGGVAIGTIDGSETGAAGLALKIGLNASATPAAVTALLAAIRFSTSDAPAASRTFSVTVNDGAATSTAATAAVAVTAQNDTPTLGGTFTTAGTVNDNATLSPFSGVTVADAEGDQVSLVITYTAANGTLSAVGAPAWLTGTAGNYTLAATDPATQTTRLQSLVFTPAANQVAAGATVVTSFTVTPRDSADGGADSTTQVTATSVNDLPVIDLDASTGGGDFSTTFAAGGDPVAIAQAAATLTDADPGPLASLTVVITNLQDGANESLASSYGTGLQTVNGESVTIGAYDSGTGRLVISGTASAATYQLVLRSILYSNSAALPNTTDRSVTVVANDGVGDSVTRTATVHVRFAPIIDLNGGGAGGGNAVTFTEDGGAVSLADLAATLTDDGSDPDISGLVIEMSNPQAGDVLALTGHGTGTTFNGITVTYNSDSRITLSGTGTKADYLTLVKAATFNTLSHTPDTTSRAVTFLATDKDGNPGATATATVTVVAVNDVPVLATNTGRTVAEAATVTIGAAHLAVTDQDNPAASSLVYTLTAAPANGTLWLDANGNASLDPGEALAVNSTFTQADIAANRLKYTHNGGETAADGFGFSFGDAAGAAVTGNSFALTVTPVNDAPTVTPGTGAALFGAAAVPVAAGLTLADPDSATFSRAVVTITNVQDVGAESLSSSYGSGPQTVNGETLTFTLSAGNTVMTITGTASRATYEAALRSVAYANAAAVPSLTARVVSVEVRDGSGDAGTQDSAVATRSVAINRPPTASADPLAPPRGRVASGYAYALPAGSFADPGDTLSYSAAGLPGGLTINAATGAVSGTPTATGTFTVTITVTDGGGLTAARTMTLAVDAAPVPVQETSPTVNRAETVPVVAAPPAVTAPPGGDGGSLAVITAGNIAGAGLSGLPTIAAVRGETGSGLTTAVGPASGLGGGSGGGIGPASGLGGGGIGAGLGIGVGSGAGGASAPLSSIPLAPTLSAPNDAGFRVAVVAPQAGSSGLGDVVVARPVGVVEALGGRVSFAIPVDAFAVTRPDNSVSLNATRADGRPLPGWMSFNPATGRFEGTPPPGERAVVVKVTARDQNGHEASQVIQIRIGTAARGAEYQGGPPAEKPGFAGRSGLAGQLAAALPGGGRAAEVARALVKARTAST